ncbi:MAG: ABC transporter permease [Rhodospirillaceae bacterium]|nr:ABC transporter permease [Rhodospirillaceae bacterium]
MADLASHGGIRSLGLGAAGRPLRGLADLWVEADWIRRLAAVAGLLLVAVAIATPIIAPFDPAGQSLLARLRPPIGFERAVPDHLLGTDELGRDVLSRCLHGLRLTLGLALFGSCIGLVLGTALGMLAGTLGRWCDTLVMGLVDIQIAVPFTLIALLLVAVFGSSLDVLVVVLGVYGWEQYARIIRAEVLKLREMPFIESARASGASGLRIAVKHILPNVASPLVVMFTLAFSNIVLLESTLSFLGLGVQPPIATLGSMVGTGRDYMPSAPWIVAAPAVCILLVTFVVQMLGDWLRDKTDVRLEER